MPNESAPSPVTSPLVVIAMATFRRPDYLGRILPVLVEQAATQQQPTRIVVVDNDPDGGAEAAVRAWPADRVTYLHETRPGISAARNRALAAAHGDDLLIFVDDDELPTPGWLNELVSAWLSWRCAAVAGPVVAHFEGDVEPWALASGVFDRRRRPTGSLLAGAASNNLLLDLDQLRSHGLTFDEDFGLSGGSDTMLTHRLISLGAQVRWCDEAEVQDFIPAGRSTRAWVIRRTFRTSNTWSRVALALTDTRLSRTRERLDLTARGLHRAGAGLLGAGLGLFSRDLGRRARGVCAIAGGWGVILGALGGVTHEYRRPAG